MNANIVLIHRTGGDFRVGDAYLLSAHIRKYWGDEKSYPNIYLFTDTVTEELNVVGLNILPLPEPKWLGWWSKMNLFSDELKHLRPFLYLDLDTAVLKSIKELIPPKKSQDNFVTLRDFYRPNSMASGLMWVPDTPLMTKVYSEWKKVIGLQKSTRKVRGDQNFIEGVVKKPDLFWQDISKPDFITTFKPLNEKRRPEWRIDFPVNSAVVCFHGEPRIPTAANHVEWVKSYVSYEI